jgi:hypothetical protein
LAIDQGDQSEFLRVRQAQFQGQQFGDVSDRHGRPQGHRSGQQTALVLIGN